MSKFLSELNVELVSDSTNSGRGTWRLTKPLVYQSDIEATTFTVPVGFETDFCSCPRTPVAFLLVADSAHEASALHDWLYTAPHPICREMADALLEEAALATGVPAWRAWLLWAGVRMGGASHWDE